MIYNVMLYILHNIVYVTSFYCVCLGIFASKLSSVGGR